MRTRMLMVTACALAPAAVHAQGFTWARAAGGQQNDYAWSVSVDAAGNAYAAGVFQGTIAFGATPCSPLTSAGGNDVFFAKYGPAGNCLWARRAGGAGYDAATRIHVDAGGRLYLAGFFVGPAVFGTLSVTGASFDGFVARIDPATGGVMWVRTVAGPQDAFTQGVASDFFGNAYVAGRFTGTAGVGSTVLTSAGGRDVFVAAYNQSGTLLWARRAGGAGDDMAYGIAADPPGNVYVAGMYSGSAVFGTLPPLAASGPGGDAFLAKYNLGGAAQWVQKAGAANGTLAEAVAVVPQGSFTASPHVYLAGNLTGGAAFTSAGGGITAVPAAAGQRGFVADYSAGGVVQWVRTSTGAVPRAVAADAAGTVLLAGEMTGPAAFAGAGSTVLGLAPTAAAQDVFTAGYDPAGTPLWARSAGGPSGDTGLGVAAGPGGGAWITGSFSPPNANWGTIQLPTAGSSPFSDAFVARLGCSAQPAGGNMVAWWSGTPGVNTAAPDGSGKGNHGTIAGGTNYGAGKVGQAFVLSGGAAAIFVPSSPTLNFGNLFAGDFSIDLWLRVPASFASVGLRTLVDKRQTSPLRGYHLALLNGSPVLELADGLGSTTYPSNLPSLADGNWHMLAVTVRRLSLTGIRWYLDGAAGGTQSNPLLHPGSLSNASSLRLGLPYFVGSLDEVEIFNRVLTPAEVGSIFTAGSFGKCP